MLEAVYGPSGWNVQIECSDWSLRKHRQFSVSDQGKCAKTAHAIAIFPGKGVPYAKQIGREL